MLKQQTLKSPAHISGIGLHSGKTVSLSIQPAPENTSIVFRRIDLTPAALIPATTEFVSDTRFNTCLTKDGVTVALVEHVLSAIAGLGVDNAYVDLDAIEPPATDGSAQDFVRMIQTAGLEEQPAPKKCIRILREIRVTEGDKFVCLAPHDGFACTMSIEFTHPFIAQTTQTLHIDPLTPTAYVEKICGARTFGFLAEYDMLRKNNLALGAGLENTLVLDDTKLLNEGGLRNDSEFVAHKLLDAIGDLQLLGHPIIGKFSGHKSGHTLNHQLRLALLKDPTAWEWTTQ